MSGVIDLEFHQLDLRFAHLRVKRPERQRRLLASLADAGQQVPIVVVAVAGEPDRYRVIDGFKRIAALRRLGRDTVRATIWPMTEADALVLDRSLRSSEAETALEQGWLLVELESRFNYDLEQLAHLFDRSVSWVSRRLALVELLPDGVQELVRSGAVTAHVAMRFLVPAARIQVEACERMAEGFARLKLRTREAGLLYAAWRDSSPKMRERLLEDPGLFLKAHREIERDAPADHSPAREFLRDVEMLAAIAARTGRRWNRAAPLLDRTAIEDARHRLDRVMDELARLTRCIEREEKGRAEQETTDDDSGAASSRSADTADRTAPGDIPIVRQESDPVGHNGSARAGPIGESRALQGAGPGAVRFLPGQPGPGP